MNRTTWDDTFQAEPFSLAARASADARGEFLAKTYLHLTGAVIAFAGCCAFWLSTPLAGQFAQTIGNTPFLWFVVIGAFALVGHVANTMARSETSMAAQYAGLALYVVVESLLFAPLLYIAQAFGGPGVIPTAAVLTLAMFVTLSMVVFLTRKNFSFLAPALSIACIAALVLVGCSMIFGFSLGIVFTVAMLVVAGGYVLYYTSAVLHDFRVDQHVAASLALFAAIALVFWYMIQLVMRLQSRD